MPKTEKKPISNEEFMRHIEEKTNAFNAKFNVLVESSDSELDSDEAIATFLPKARDPKA
jgi:hypothetical protein